MDRQAYINHLLNQSASKQTHQFPKAQRFPKSQKVYILVQAAPPRPSMLSLGPPPKEPPPSASAVSSILPINHPHPLLDLITCRATSKNANL